jgi:hypothetical protein
LLCPGAGNAAGRAGPKGPVDPSLEKTPGPGPGLEDQ